ncbi:hypothetical protein T484DRAFT_1870969, partial [Baffinella frigidus]
GISQQLLAVDGRAVKGLRVQEIARFTLGAPGSACTLLLRGPGVSNDASGEAVRQPVGP